MEADLVSPRKIARESVNVVKKNKREDRKLDLKELAAKRKRRESKTQPSYQQSLQILSVVSVYYDRKESKIIFLWKRNSSRTKSALSHRMKEKKRKDSRLMKSEELL